MATFYIQTDKEYYLAGDTITGHVLVNVQSSISGISGISLKFSGYECIKWLKHTEIKQPKQSQMPISRGQRSNSVCKNQEIYHTDKIQISDCQSQVKEANLKPSYIRTANNKFYNVAYHEKREELCKSKANLYEGGNISKGQYSYPFSIKTFSSWPSSFAFNQEQIKANVAYHLTATFEPSNLRNKFSANLQLILNTFKQSHSKVFENYITSCFCSKKGKTSFEVNSNKPIIIGKKNQISLLVNNSQCTSNIKNIDLELVCQTKLQSEDILKKHSLSISIPIIQGVKSGENRDKDNPINVKLDLTNYPQILSSCHAKFIQSQIYLKVRLNYDASFYSNQYQIIPIQLSQSLKPNIPPKIFSKNITPKVMPQTVMTLQNLHKDTLTEYGTLQKFHNA